MTNNQNWFNQEYSKEEQEIECEVEEFTGNLTIENYSNLKKLRLWMVNSINKLLLRNLTNLEKCTIDECDVKELIIENCSNIQTFDLRRNNLTNLEFVKEQHNLKKLQIDNNPSLESGIEYLPDGLKTFSCENTKLTNLLKPYKSDWKAYQKDLQRIITLASQNPQKLLKIVWDFKEKIKQLEEQHPVALDKSENFEKKYLQMKKFLHFLVNEERLKTEEIRILKTEDLTAKLSEQKDNLLQTEQAVGQKTQELSELQKINRQLKSKLDFFEQIYQTTKKRIVDKKKELEMLKENLLAKTSSYDKQKLEKKLAKLLRFQADIVIFNSPSLLVEKEELKEALIKKSSLTDNELDQFCSLQTEITRLELKMQKSFNSQQFQQIINNYHIVQSIVAQSSRVGGDFNPQMDVETREFINEILIPTDHLPN